MQLAARDDVTQAFGVASVAEDHVGDLDAGRVADAVLLSLADNSNFRPSRVIAILSPALFVGVVGLHLVAAAQVHLQLEDAGENGGETGESRP